MTGPAGVMDLSTFERLLSADGQAALAVATEMAPAEIDFLPCFRKLSHRFPDDLARAALETVLLRRRARAKFSRADAMYFTREALEQSSGEAIAHHRARRFAGFARVADLCCGIGGDCLGLTEVADVLAVDLDPLRLAMAAANLDAYERRGRVAFVEADVLKASLVGVEAVFCDPDRRTGGRRRLSLHDYRPTVEAVRSYVTLTLPLGVKVAPGVPWEELAAQPAEAEFVSFEGELKECALWFGPLRTAARRATLLPGPRTLVADAPAPPRPLGPPRTYLYDPDPAVVRSGLVSSLAEEIDAYSLDSEIAYLTADRFEPTPFARAYRIDEALPFHLGRLREALRARQVGHVTITKRGSAVDVGDLSRRLKLSGPETRTVVLTRVIGKPYALIVAPMCEAADDVQNPPGSA